MAADFTSVPLLVMLRGSGPGRVNGLGGRIDGGDLRRGVGGTAVIVDAVVDRGTRRWPRSGQGVSHERHDVDVGCLCKAGRWRNVGCVRRIVATCRDREGDYGAGGAELHGLPLERMDDTRATPMPG